ncbi:phosphatidylinositol N-acetylglucosaminyltransferase subunit C isoform X1 [Hydra vulgaris]|nr:phosphatidylinositol N-acetylglucosaminyltransferase subunit C isoform X1 [Hydra vulgaris]
MSEIKWCKVLYKHQPFEDNYTSKTFLDEMKKNVNTKIYDLPRIIFESGVVSQQLSSICLFVSIFWYLEVKILSPINLLFALLLCFCIGVSFRKVIGKKGIGVSSCFIVSSFVFAISPILKTLTKSISTDTIYAMTTCMLLANMLFQDYGAGAAIVSKVISLNTSIFAAVCLGSRLSSSLQVYAFVMLAVEIFALFPELRKDIKCWCRGADIFLTETMAIFTTLLLAPVSRIAACGLVLAHFMITFFFPIWMYRLQRYKNNIHGPWDEARISNG